MAGQRRRNDRAADRNRLAKVPYRGRQSVGRDVDTRTELDEGANFEPRDRAPRRRRRPRAALCEWTPQPSRAPEIAHRAARDAQIDRAARAQGSRAPRSVRAPDRSVGPLRAIVKGEVLPWVQGLAPAESSPTRFRTYFVRRGS